MYHRFVNSKVRSAFAQISTGNWEPMVKALAPRFSYRFHGDSALSGERHGHLSAARGAAVPASRVAGPVEEADVAGRVGAHLHPPPPPAGRAVHHGGEDSADRPGDASVATDIMSASQPGKAAEALDRPLLPYYLKDIIANCSALVDTSVAGRLVSLPSNPVLARCGP